MDDIPEETVLYWKCRRTENSATREEAELETEDLITDRSDINALHKIVDEPQ